MSSAERDELHALILQLLEEAEQELEGDLENDTPLIQSGLLDSLSLLELADWIAEKTSAPIDLKTLDIREEWNTIERILAFVDRLR